MATEKAMKVAREIVQDIFNCNDETMEDSTWKTAAIRGAVEPVAEALDHHGAALARLAAVFMAQKVLDGEIAMVDDAVQHAKEAQDE